MSSKQSVASDIFHEIDKNNDGKISRDELREGLKIMQLPSNDEVVNTLLEKLDTDKNGEISLEEFNAFATKKSEELKQVFEKLDSDKNEYVDLKEAQESLRGLHIDEKKLKALWERMDKDKDGRFDSSYVSLEEWQRLMLLSPYTQLNELLGYWTDAQAMDQADSLKLYSPIYNFFAYLFSHQSVYNSRLLAQGDEGFVPVPTSKLRAALGYLTAGAVAGAASRTATAPLERLKILYQVNTGKSPSLMEGMRTIYKDGGAKGLFRGNLANVLKVAPESGIKFFTYEAIKEILSRDGKREIGSADRFIAGASAGVAAHVSTFPLEVVKTRLAAAPAGTYNGIIDTVAKIMMHEGRIMPFYQGLSASLMSTIPHSGINMTVYEGLKQVAITYNGATEEPGPTVLLMCATAASVCGQIVGYPFHVAKARLIMQHKKALPYKNSIVPTMDHYTGVTDVFRRVLKHEGPKGLFKGIVPSFLKSVPAHGITFLVYEYFKRTFNIEKKKHHK